jgi:MFS transporter, DHA1 family, tetracycline resistance protein
MMSDLPSPPLAVPKEVIAAGSKRSAVFIVFLVVFVDLLGFGIVFPLLARYGQDFIDPLIPGGQEAQLGGIVLGLLIASFSAMQFLFLPLWGRLSDRVGRRPILLLGLVGSVVFYTVFGIASGMNNDTWRLVGLVLLFLSRIGAGIAGATIGIAQAVIADSTAPQQRARSMALIGVAIGIGYTVGPLSGGLALALWPESRGAPGYMAAGFSLLALALGIALLPETWRGKGEGASSGWLDWHGLRSIVHTRSLTLLVAGFFIANLAFTHFQATLSLLTLDALDFTDAQNFLIWGYAGLILILTQGGLYQMLARKFHTRDWTLMLIGVVLLVVGLACMGAVAALGSPPSAMLVGILVGVGLTAVGFAFLNPSTQSLISRFSDPALQGEILGLNQSSAALARILGTVVGAYLYRLPPVHVLPYASATLMMVVVLWLTFRMPQE